jgi:succinate dehydrogenase/fumarate reductase flavoprotein subunit
VEKVHYEELIQQHAPLWPYPVRYGQENEVSCDVLVLGGGIAGCWAAISAARKGVRVVLVEKSATSTSGSGGTGVDHWNCAVTNPACKISPEEYAQAMIDNFGGWRCGIGYYITCRESYDCLLELEKIGVKIRDSEDEFKGAEFRDESTKFLYAYDYANKFTIRVWGSYVKRALKKECQRLGIKIYDRVMLTSLLSAGGHAGARVVGATGLNVLTGEFYIFKGKASILAMGGSTGRNWSFSTELRGLTNSIAPGNLSGDGLAMAWLAGAEFAAAEQSHRAYSGPYSYPALGIGHSQDTWYACSLVDESGKEIPWLDRDGRELKTVSERYRPVPGQRFFLSSGMPRSGAPIYAYSQPYPGVEAYDFDWRQLAKQGKYTLPIYADLPGMPEMERKVIFRLMLAQEGKTLVPIYRTYTQAGFDPDRDMLQCYAGGVRGFAPPQWRAGGGGLVVDWDLRTNLEGLYAAGSDTFAPGDHAYAATTGSYAGRKAAQYAQGVSEPVADPRQIAAEKARVLAPLYRSQGIEWKELHAGVCKVMQDYCGEVKSEELLKLGLKWLDEITAGEAQTASARNPHELMRLLEVFNIMTHNRLILEACRARRATHTRLGFDRVDFPVVDAPEWDQWLTMKLVDGQAQSGKLPLDYHGDLKKNYDAHCAL